MANRQIIPKIMSAEEIKPTYTRPNQYSDVDFRRWYERGHTALEKTSNVPAVIYGICETYIYIYICCCKGVFGTVPVRPVPEWMCRTHQSVRYQY